MRPTLRSWHFFSLLVGATPLLYELPLVTTFVCTPFLCLFAWNLWIRQVIFPTWTLQILALFSAAFFYKTYGTLLSPESASSLMAFVLCLKLFDIQNYRDTMIFIIMNLLLMMFYVLFSQTLFSTFLLFMNYFFFIFFLLDLQKQKLGIRQDPLSLRQLLSVETLVALPLLISLFLFFPRFTTSWSGVGAATSQGVLGFSEKLQPGHLQNLIESEQIAFRVLFKNKELPPQENLYFRGAVLTQHEGWQWSRSQNFQGIFTNTSSQQNKDYEILLEPRFEKTLFTLEPTDSISLFPQQLLFYQTPDSTFQLHHSAQSKIKIQGHFRQQLTLQKDLATATDLTTTHQASPKLKSLLDGISSQSDQEKLSSLLKIYQNRGFEYTTQTPSYDTIEDFLFGEKKGFCEHFASSFGILSRLVGLPSRVVVGFQGADINPFGSYLIVKDKHAHAWNEVYLKEKGWVHVDITSLVAPQRIFQGTLFTNQARSVFGVNALSTFERMSYAWDAINSQFNLMLMNYNLESQSQLLEKWNLKKWGITSVTKGFFVILILILFIAWILSRRKNEPVDLLSQSYLLLNHKLEQLQIHRESSEGPHELRRKVLQLKGDVKNIVYLIDRYISLRYRANATPHESLHFYKEVKALRISK